MRIASTALPLIFATAITGCGSSIDEPVVPKKLEVYSWLTSGAEKTALDNLFGVMKGRIPDVTITNAAQDRSDLARAELPMRMAAGNPPDSFQAIGGADLLEWQKRGTLEPVDSIIAELGGALPAGVLESVKGPDGKYYGIPLNLERDNTLFYNKTIIDGTNIKPPTTIAEFFTVAEQIKALGKVPLSVSASGGWTIASHVFEAVLVAEGGADFYLDYMQGRKAADDPIVVQTLRDVARMMEYANDDRATTGWGAAVKKVCTGEAAMLILPDFTKGQFQTEGCGTATNDNIGYVPMQPKDVPTFVYVGITFPITKGAPHHDMAVEFAKVVGSKEGQEAFNPVKGSIPARTDVDRSKFDPISAQTAADFAITGAKIVPGYAALTSSGYQGAVNPALQAFVDPTKTEFKNVDTLVGILRQSYSIIKP